MTRDEIEGVLLKHLRVAPNVYFKNPKTNSMTIDLDSVREAAVALAAQQDGVREALLPRFYSNVLVDAHQANRRGDEEAERRLRCVAYALEAAYPDEVRAVEQKQEGTR